MRAAVVGLGYVGLPLAIRLSQIGLNVVGIDKNLEKIISLQKGILPFAQDEPHLKEHFRNEFAKKQISFSDDFLTIKDRDLIFINVDTPIIGRRPNYTTLIKALKSVGPNIKKEAIVIIESTVSPNTTKKLVSSVLEKESGMKLNRDFFVACVPERIRPNHIFEQLTKLSRVVGVSDIKITNKLKKLYSKITSGQIDITDLTTAETVKTVENTLRDVDIAFANEIAQACEELGVNVWEVQKLVNKSPFHKMLSPGTGVGGHCIPKDPWLLASSVKKQMNLIKNSRKINDSMPSHIMDLISLFAKKNKNSIDVALLGYSYVEETDDTRNSPTESLVKLLKKKKINYQIHDPYIKEYSQKAPEEVAKNKDVLVLMVSHHHYKKLNFSQLYKVMSQRIILDCKNFLNKNEVESYGFIYKGIGNI